MTFRVFKSRMMSRTSSRPSGSSPEVVEKHDVRLVQQRLCETDALQHALAVLPQRSRRGIEQVDARQQLLDARLEPRTREAVETAMET